MSQSERLVLATRYRLVSELGQGANGTVWRGHDELLDRAVAIKELRLPDELSEDDRVVFYRRTLREARAPAQLRTHNIVEVYDVVIEQGRPWIVMEMIEAPNLEQLIEGSGPLPPARVAHIGRALLDALDIAHRAGIVHRDLKPSNVLLDGDRVVLTDFGLAFSSGSASLTKTGHFMGSPAYVAPEVAAGEKATPRSDLWSLGATLYAALEGRPPFERHNVMATLSALANESIPAPQHAGALAPVITGLLEKNPTRRLSHARAADRLERALTGPRRARRAETPRYRVMVVIGLIGATVASCGIGATALIVGMTKNSGSSPAPPASDPPAPGVPAGVASSTLAVRARNATCKIFVSVPGGVSTVLTDATLVEGEVRKYDQPRLNAVIYDASACDVWVNGRQKPLGSPGERKSYSLNRAAPGD
ncbi:MULTISPECIES: serine/threonine-protein kinase [Actinomadura]|uniref:non-specific serine/threonine protein kinase n=1 Tax=Actinomadura litoris TaxID=2678616 RepID=A0A7K1L6J9_9ACTN|nr:MULTISPECIES: serine/threonine-protein kinase [Actinomadura]MBT2213934.1 serine/threonine protein kinase [Actinomadura sp. NEAU-AAG7]MUN39906.1 protein kinase [Actinomadura litoris]